MKYEDYDNEDPSQKEYGDEDEEQEEVSLPKKAMPNKTDRERNSDLRSKETSYDNSGTAAKKNNARFKSSRMDDEEEDEAETERRALELREK